MSQLSKIDLLLNLELILLWMKVSSHLFHLWQLFFTPFSFISPRHSFYSFNRLYRLCGMWLRVTNITKQFLEHVGKKLWFSSWVYKMISETRVILFSTSVAVLWIEKPLKIWLNIWLYVEVVNMLNLEFCKMVTFQSLGVLTAYLSGRAPVSKSILNYHGLCCTGC